MKMRVEQLGKDSRPSKFPCCVLLALSWNTTNENPSTDKLSRAINYWGPFLLYVPYKSWATFYAVNLLLISDDASPNELKLQSSYDNNKIESTLEENLVAAVVVLNSQTEECHPGQDIVHASLTSPMISYKSLSSKLITSSDSSTWTLPCSSSLALAVQYCLMWVLI